MESAYGGQASVGIRAANAGAREQRLLTCSEEGGGTRVSLRGRFVGQ